jgi:hypothetical protein
LALLAKLATPAVQLAQLELRGQLELRLRCPDQLAQLELLELMDQQGLLALLGIVILETSPMSLQLFLDSKPLRLPLAWHMLQDKQLELEANQESLSFWQRWFLTIMGHANSLLIASLVAAAPSPRTFLGLYQQTTLVLPEP